MRYCQTCDRKKQVGGAGPSDQSAFSGVAQKIELPLKSKVDLPSIFMEQEEELRQRIERTSHQNPIKFNLSLDVQFQKTGADVSH